MHFSYLNTYNNSFRADTAPVMLAAAPLAKPIEKVQQTIETVADTFVKEKDEDKKKSNKTAIAVASSVLVISGLVMLLNPKNSNKLISKLKNLQVSARTAGKTKQNTFMQKFYKAGSKALGGSIKTLEFANNFNSAKDIWFKKLCTDGKGVSKILKTPHNAITKWFNSISKHTVFDKYKSASKKLDSLELLINEYKNTLTPEEMRLIETKLKEAKTARKYFARENISSRLETQEGILADVGVLTEKKIENFSAGLWKMLKNKRPGKLDYLRNNLSFWAQDIMLPSREKLEKEGNAAVEKLFGNGKNTKGIYEEIFDIISPNLKADEKVILEKAIKKSNKKLQKANLSECVEYFDKKRDLTLGSAPTDVVTAIAGLGLSGAAVISADNKEERISRTLTGGFPIVAGLGASMAFTAMLFSGVQGMLYGALTSIGLSKIGSLINNYFLRNNSNNKPQEVQNA